MDKCRWKTLSEMIIEQESFQDNFLFKAFKTPSQSKRLPMHNFRGVFYSRWDKIQFNLYDSN